MADRAPGSQETQVPRRAPVSFTPGDEALRELLSPLSYGEAPQIGIVGDTGAGKTTILRALVEMYLRLCTGWALVIDDKELRARYAGQERKDLEDLRLHPVDTQGPRVVVFRGDPRAGIAAKPEEVAELAWRRAARGLQTLILHDELVAGREDLVKNRNWRKGVTYVPRSFTKGRAVGVADAWAAQSPSEVPIDPWEQSNGIISLKLDGLGLEKLRERNYLRGGADVVIPRLHAMEVPPPQRGDFVVLRRGQDWNGKIYKLEEVSS